MYLEISRNVEHPERTYQPAWHQPENVLMQGVRSLYNEIPANLRMVTEYALGINRPYTEKDFTPAQLRAMQQQYEQTRNVAQDAYALARSNQDSLTLENALQRDPAAAEAGYSAKEIYDSLTQRYADQVGQYERRVSEHRTPVAKYGAGGDVNNQGWGNVLSGFFDPNEQVGTTLGRYNVLETPRGAMIYDLYNFDKQGYEKEEPFSWDMLSHPVKGVDWALRKYGPQHSAPVQIMLPK